jgi:hypothetical protein
MGCLLTTGFNLACGKPAGGIREIYFGNWTEVDGLIVFENTAGANFGKVKTLPEDLVLYKYKLDQQSASFSCTQSYSKDNQSSFWTHTVTFKRRGISQALINELYNMTQGKIVCFLRDENNDFFLLGYERGLDVTGGGGFASGTALGDMNGSDWVLTGDQKSPLAQCMAYTTNPFDFSSNLPTINAGS